MTLIRAKKYADASFADEFVGQGPAGALRPREAIPGTREDDGNLVLFFFALFGDIRGSIF